MPRAEDIDWDLFGSVKTLGITAGASAPEVLVEEIIDSFREALHGRGRGDLDDAGKRVLPAAALAAGACARV